MSDLKLSEWHWWRSSLLGCYASNEHRAFNQTIKQSKMSSHTARYGCIVQVKLTGVACQKYWCYALGRGITGTSVWTSL